MNEGKTRLLHSQNEWSNSHLFEIKQYRVSDFCWYIVYHHVE